MIITKLGAYGNKLIGPPGDADRMLRIVGGKASPASDLVFKVFVSHGEEGTGRNTKHGIIQHRPFRRIAVPYWKRAALEWHFAGRMIDRIVHVHVPGFGRGIN